MLLNHIVAKNRVQKCSLFNCQWPYCANHWHTRILSQLKSESVSTKLNPTHCSSDLVTVSHECTINPDTRVLLSLASNLIQWPLFFIAKITVLIIHFWFMGDYFLVELYFFFTWTILLKMYWPRRGYREPTFSGAQMCCTKSLIEILQLLFSILAARQHLTDICKQQAQSVHTTVYTDH